MLGNDFSSCNDFSAAVRSSPFFRFASEMRCVSSLPSSVAAIVFTVQSSHHAMLRVSTHLRVDLKTVGITVHEIWPG